MIYHIVIESDFRAQIESAVYLPSDLPDQARATSRAAGPVRAIFRPAR
jgi:hypothetical protein